MSIKTKIVTTACILILLSALGIGLNASGITSAAYSLIENAGSALTMRPTLNFTGGGCVASDDAAHNRTLANCTGGSGFAVEVNGTPLTSLTTLNLAAGSGMTLTPTGSGTYTVTFVSSGGSGGPTNQNNVTVSRSYNSVFQNTGTSPLFVSTAGFTSVNNQLMSALTDSSNPPTTNVADIFLPSASTGGGLFFIVLPGNFYEVTIPAGVATVFTWIEWN